MDENKQTEQQILEMFADTPKEFTITLTKRNIIQKIRKIKEKKYEIKPLVAIKFFEITRLFNECRELFIPDNLYNILANSIVGIVKYEKQIVKIVSLFINESEKFVLNNLSIKELQKFFVMLSQHLDFVQFFFILESAKSKTIMTNPETKSKLGS